MREGEDMKYESDEYWSSLIKMSVSRFFILHVLHTHPLHGYEISKEVAALTKGCCAPTEGSLYPLLREFMEAGLVTEEMQVVSGRKRKVYTLTPVGEQSYRVAAVAWSKVARYILEAVEGETHEMTVECNPAEQKADEGHRVAP
jgi:PadR family transcriptional regulator PadR